MGSLLAGSAPSEMPLGTPQTASSVALSLETRLQASREKRAIEHILSLEERLDTCRGQFDSIRTNPVFSSALQKVQNGELDKKDFFLDLARSPRSGPQDTMQLDTAINNFHHSIAELNTLTRQVERSCEKAGIDSADIMENVGTFFEELDGPEGELMPNANDGNTIAEKIKEFMEKFMAFFRRAPEEDSYPSPA